MCIIVEIFLYDTITFYFHFISMYFFTIITIFYYSFFFFSVVVVKLFCHI